jgi:Fur family ferric uptake transcriptional regulator
MDFIVSAMSRQHDQVGRRLGEAEIRFTRGRRAVITALEGAGRLVSTGELHRRMRGSVPLSSLYRSLNLLERAGVLRKQHGSDGLARFELAEWLAGHHHHLVCLVCGRAEDTEVEAVAERVVSDLAGRIGARAGFEVRGHVLEIEGICESCRK